MWKLTVKQNVNDLYSEHSLSWEAQTKSKLIEEYANHLFEHDRGEINQINELHKISCVYGSQLVAPSTSSQKWDFKDKVNAALEELHEEYLNMRGETDNNNYQYQCDTMPI